MISFLQASRSFDEIVSLVKFQMMNGIKNLENLLVVKKCLNLSKPAWISINLLVLLIIGVVYYMTNSSREPNSRENQLLSNVKELQAEIDEHPDFLSRLIIKNKDLSGLQLKEVTLKHVDWDNIQLNDSFFENVKIDGGTVKDISFSGSKLVNVTFENVTFESSKNLMQMSISYNNWFDNTNVNDLTINGSKLENITFRKILGTNIYFNGSQLYKVRLSDSQLNFYSNNSKLSYVSYRDSKTIGEVKIVDSELSMFFYRF